MSTEILLELNRARFVEGLKCVGICVPRRGALIQQFKCVRFRVQNEKLFLSTMGSNHACDFMFNDKLTGIPDIDGAVEYSKLFYTTSKSKRENVAIRWNPEDKSFHLRLEGNSRLNVLPVDNWKETPRDNIRTIREMDPKEFKQAWASTSFTITPEITRYDLRGIYYDGDWVTSNGHYISIYRAGGKKASILISPDVASFVNLIGSPSLKVVSMEMRVRGDSHLVMIARTETGSLRYMVLLSASEFPNWRVAYDRLKEMNTHRFTVRRRDFEEILGRIAAFVDKNRFAVLDLNKQTLQVTAKSLDTAENTVEVMPLAKELEEGFEPISIMLNYDMLWNVTSENSEDIIVFNYSNNQTPVLLSVGEKEYIVAAIRETT